MSFKKIIVSSILFSLITSVQAETKKILMLGQSGTGKTTTINAIYNAAMHNHTPQDNKHWVQFIAPMREGSEEQIPCPNSIPITSVEKTTTYAEFAFKHGRILSGNPHVKLQDTSSHLTFQDGTETIL